MGLTSVKDPAGILEEERERWRNTVSNLEENCACQSNDLCGDPHHEFGRGALLFSGGWRWALLQRGPCHIGQQENDLEMTQRLAEV